MGLLTKVMQFAKSAQGKKAIHEAEQAAENPKTQQAVKDEARKLGL